MTVESRTAENALARVRNRHAQLVEAERAAERENDAKNIASIRSSVELSNIMQGRV